MSSTIISRYGEEWRTWWLPVGSSLFHHKRFEILRHWSPICSPFYCVVQPTLNKRIISAETIPHEARHWRASEPFRKHGTESPWNLWQVRVWARWHMQLRYHIEIVVVAAFYVSRYFLVFDNLSEKFRVNCRVYMICTCVFGVVSPSALSFCES